MMAGRTLIMVRRIYDEPTRADGIRVLVDRVWPRGLSKDNAGIDEWCKQVAPSAQLRRWYAHDPGRFAEFDRRSTPSSTTLSGRRQWPAGVGSGSTPDVAHRYQAQ
jgi:hypothetical protein